MSSTLRRSLRTRARQARSRPEFRRQESWRLKRVKESWRRPRGIDSHMRKQRRGWHKLVNVGYRSIRRARSLHPSGLQEVLVHNVADLEGLDPQMSAVRIAHTVGSRSRIEIGERAKELGLKILNFKEAKEAEPSGTEETGSTTS